MRPNATRLKLDRGEAALGINMASASPLVAETLGHSGFDWVMIDLQHGENNLGNLAGMLTAVSATPATPFVRVVANDSGLIQRAFDVGAYGVCVPLINTAADAEAAVRAMRYPPKGDRSWGPVRGALYGGSDYFAASAQELQLVVMIETVGGIAQADAIMAVEGIAGCLIGTNDFSLALGRPPRPVPDTAPMDPTVEEAVSTVLRAAQRHGKAPGIFTTDPAMAARRVEQGFCLISMPGDVASLKAYATAALRTVREGGSPASVDRGGR